MEYVQSDEMIADGLTKALPSNRWSKFLDQLGLKDVKEYLSEKEADLTELEHRMDALDVENEAP